MIRIFGIIFILTASCGLLQAQSQGFTLPRFSDQGTRFINEPVIDTVPGLPDNSGQWHVNMNMGTVFGTTFGGGSVFSTYFAPEVSYDVSQRFRVKAGVMMVNNFNTSSGAFESGTPFRSMYSYSTVYVTGQYLLSPNLMISGTAFKSFPMGVPTGSGLYQSRYDYQGIAIDIDYSPFRNLHIGASFMLIDGDNPYSGFQNYNTPFYRPSPFSTFPGRWQDF